ncbi:hypothetical protein ACFL9S_07705 [Erwinia sp. AnSW2-5]|uniref:hypothetical protein n=1 Tax=Erwinia sp. AnSW2-5 TaxID=3367692 RepID=UPI00385DD232
MRKSRIALTVLASLTASFQTLASSDIQGCIWGSKDCFIVSPPVLDVTNDTRDNLLRLVSETKPVTLASQPVPEDLTRSRSFWFGYHDDAAPAPTPAASVPPSPSPLESQIAALGLAANVLETAKLSQGDEENRHVSNTLETVSLFFSALLADTSLTPEQRQALAIARLSLPERQQADTLSFPDGSPARAFRDYLLAASDFYQGDYPAAAQTFTALQTAKQPWVAETASYMLMRTALNQSSENANGEYGDFDVKKIDKNAAAEARTAALAYLTAWPKGQYAKSAYAMLRRIDWYLENWDLLADHYEEALDAATDNDEIVALIAENDLKLQSKDQSGDAVFTSATNAPLLTFTQTLRLMRSKECNPRLPCVDQAYLDALMPSFDQARKLPLWHYLTLMQSFRTGDYPAVIANIKPITELPARNIVAFSEQALYGDALMAQQQWPAARDHWTHLLTLSKDPEQQQFVQARLAAALVSGNEVAQIFAADSRVTSLRYRSLVLKTRATPELLRQQVSKGPNDEERTIALHTLLIRDLTEARYAEWLQDRKLSQHITQPVGTDAFADVQLSVFDWTGEETEKGYACPTLETVVTQLSQQADNSHALNCLSEFFRTTNASVTTWPDSGGNGTLDTAVTTEKRTGQPNRQYYYQQVIGNSKTEPEDKSYALYRAVMCYAPSGYNDCGGKEVDKTQRQRWFTQLKKQYPGSTWANKLKYYW